MLVALEEQVSRDRSLAPERDSVLLLHAGRGGPVAASLEEGEAREGSACVIASARTRDRVSPTVSHEATVPLSARPSFRAVERPTYEKLAIMAAGERARGVLGALFHDVQAETDGSWTVWSGSVRGMHTIAGCASRRNRLRSWANARLPSSAGIQSAIKWYTSTAAVAAPSGTW